MEDKPERLVDYFVAVGLGSNAAPFESNALEGVDHGNSCDPVTDIAIIFRKSEVLPKGYKCLEKTANGTSANLNSGAIFAPAMYICYAQGRDKAPVVDIGAYCEDLHSKGPPKNHDLITRSLGEKDAGLSSGAKHPTYLTYKKGIFRAHNVAITGLCLIAPAKGEEPPPGYKKLNMDLNRGRQGQALYLCYKKRMVRPPSVPYMPELLCRYPLEDYPQFPLAGNIPLFCCPFGVSVEHWDSVAYPLPTFSTFALTNELGHCMYGVVVEFYEDLKQHDQLAAIKGALGVDDKAELKVNKCICVLSHWPFFTSFKAFLSNLYRLSISPGLPLPLERYIGNLLLETQLPTLERPQVLQQMGSERLVFALPVQTSLPLSVSTHWSLLSSLDGDNCVTLLTLLLLEQKVVIHSARRALVTCVAEALKSILFPFSWQCTYIPMCPLAFSSFMQAPVPFIIGIDSRYFDDILEVPDACIVDLDDNRITLNEDGKTLLKKCPLPVKPVKLLKQKLKDLAGTVAALNPTSDYAVDVTSVDASDSYKADLEALDLRIRETFLQFHALLLSSYRLCLKPLISAPSEKCRDIGRLFNYEQFLKYHPSAEQSFYRAFFDTQIFITFVDERSFGQKDTGAFAFFDECVEKLMADPTSELINVKAAIHRHSDLPTVVALPAEAFGVESNITYSYDTFPILKPELFRPLVTSSLPTCELKPAMSSSSLTTHSPTMARRTVAEKAKDKHDLEKAVHNDILWAKSLLSHVCSLWYVMLPSHVSLYWNKTGVLRQALEIFEDMRKRKALSGDEVCYRILMEQCVKLGRPALAVRVYHEMRRAGIQPNAVTYSFYNKVVLEGKWPSTRRNWNILRTVVTTCFYLRRLPHTGHFLKDHPTTTSQLGADRISLTSSISSIATTFNEIGLDESPFSRDGEAHEGKGCVFRSSSMAGDYAIHGDYLYMAHKAPFHKAHSSSKSRRKPKRGWSPAQHKVATMATRGVLKGPRLDVEMTSCTQCPTCKTLLYDEEIMANWNENEANLKTACPNCSCQLVASLTINLKETLLASTYTANNSISEAEESSSAVLDNTVLAEDASSCGSGDHVEYLPNATHLASCDAHLASCDAIHQQPVQNGSSLQDGLLSPHDGLLSPHDGLLSPQDGPLSPQDGLLSPQDGLLSPQDGPLSPQDGPLFPQDGPSQKSDPECVNIVTDINSEGSRGDATPLPPPNIEEMKVRGHRRSSSAPINRPQVKRLHNQAISKLVVKSSESESPSVTPAVTPTPPIVGPEATYSTEASTPIIVPYLSPIVLRKEVELLLARDGSHGLDRIQLVQEKPIIYWNLVWYFSRLNLPTYLPLLQLGSFISDHEQLRNEYVQMKVDLLWDRHIPGTRFPLHLIWSGKISIPPPTDINKHLGTEYHLQSVVARITCGDIAPLIGKLLEDRRYPTGELLHRSIFREALFLKSAVTQIIPDLDIFEKEYLQIIQKLQKDFSIYLKPMDRCPSPRAGQCRREFGCLQVFTVSYTSHAGVKL